MLVRQSEEQARASSERENNVKSLPTPAPGAFEPLVGPEGQGRSEPAVAPPRSAEEIEANRVAERTISDAKDAAAQIRASAIRLVSEKLQFAEDEVLALRVRAADEVAKLRSDTARSMVVRLREAETEARALREAARDEARGFWRSTLQEFSDAQQRVAQLRAEVTRLTSELNDAVAGLDSTAYSVVALCQRRLDEIQRDSQTS
jgi:predicted secreted protein